MSRKIYAKAAHGLRSEKPSESIFKKNHYAGVSSYPAEIQNQITNFGLMRVAGNVWEKMAPHSYWKIEGNTIRKLVGNEVDEGQSIQAAPAEHTSNFISNALEDLDW